MGKRKSRGTPKYYGFRVYFSSVVLYYLLVLPFLLILFVKNAPRLNALRDNDKTIESGEFRQQTPESDSLRSALLTEGDSLNDQPFGEFDATPFRLEIDTAREILNDTLEAENNSNLGFNIGSGDNNSLTSKSFNLLFNMFLISFLLGFIFNLPFKRYFRKKRKGKNISDKLYHFCRKYILLTPLINSGILFIAYVVTHIYMLVLLSDQSNFPNEIERSYFNQFFFVSLIASTLTVLFVYFWQKHRVHIKYLEYIFSKEKLYQRIFSLKPGRIRNRLWISSGMTTLMPLLIVMLYLLLSLTTFDELSLDYKNMSEDEYKILFGDYSMISGAIDFAENSDIHWMFYVNAINSLFMFIGIYSGIFIAFIYIILVVKWTTQGIVHPVKELLQNMKRTGQGETAHFSIVRTNDEIGELTEGYNDMSQRITNYISNISKMTEAYSMFVPKQFLDFLGKKSIIDIKLGDQVQKEMTVMFSDIRSFTEISESMTPKENFDFINYYLGYMEPVIRNNNGFIDKYMGDSIMALFPNRPEDALNAAIEMRIKLSQFNQVMNQFGKPVIDSGIGIHYGNLMLGVVGGEGRYDGTVISDAVNLASRLEGLTKIYGNSIIISQDTLIKLKDPSQYHYRFLDTVKVKGKNQAVYVFEIIDGESEDQKTLKTDTKESFARAINLYKGRKFSEALTVFQGLYEKNKHDKTVALYIKRCKDFIENGVPEDWDGIEVIIRK